MAAEYQVIVRDPFGNALMAADNFASLDYARAVNSVGALTLALPDTFDARRNLYTFDTLARRDNIIEVWRGTAGRMSVDMETAWLVRAAERSLSADGRRLVTVRAYDAMHLLARRMALYASGNAKAGCATYADDALKTLVSNNLGSGATDAARSWATYVAIQANLSLAPSVAKSFAWRNVLTVAQEIAAASATASAPVYLAFDVVYTGTGTFEFRTYTGWRGADHRFPTGQNPVLLDPEQGNLSDARLSYDYSNEATHVTAGGQGEGAGRTTATASDTARIGLSPFGRIEVFVDARNTSSATAVQDEANGALRDGRPRRTFTGRLVQTPGTEYGVHFGFGDIVTANYLNTRVDCRLDGVRVAVANGTETVEAALRSDELL